MASILVVEKDSGICDLVVEVLEIELAAAVTCARTGAQGKNAIETGYFDLAVIDCGMPQISGYELAEYAINRNIPVLLYTGHPAAIAALDGHHFPHLAKPFQLHELIYTAAKIITHAADNVAQVKASFIKLRMTTDNLRSPH